MSNKPKPKEVRGWLCDNCDDFHYTYEDAYECCDEGGLEE